MPYEILIEADGGCDHNFYLQNKLALFGLFLKSGVDKLIAIPGCPGLSYLNTEERAMSVLNIGLANLSLKLEPCEWLTREVLHGASSMKAVRKAVCDYDIELPIALDILRRRRLKQKKMITATTMKMMIAMIVIVIVIVVAVTKTKKVTITK
jgi:hypothetical protein